ncbi:ubiquitin domain-containing protein UBFD1-like [Polyodon spathula]|uniref:ubiquitin domain-containing protein UBFD1-like n=1 Tax=Polyodon spathula TaxID=7913 RepID=UPI001B7E88C4|nr:ubiquitin domain-containing protein UBFD1-like [Polyodon spathula]
MPSVKGTKERLPTVPLSGMYNKSGGKVRLTFKLEQDQLWIGTKERTEKLPMGSIKNVVTEPIEGHDDYYMMVGTKTVVLKVVPAGKFVPTKPDNCARGSCS